MKERLREFDLLKGIGILLVLIGHTEFIEGLPKDLIYGFHMPLFFFCSGIFAKNTDLKDTFLKSVRQLFIPYLFFVVVLNVSYFLVNIHAGQTIPVAISNVFSGLSLFDENSHLYNTIWFLICLFIVRCLHALIGKCTSNMIVQISVGGGMYIIGYFISDIPFYIDTALSVYVYYVLGNYFFKSGLYKKKISMAWSIVICLLYVILVWVLHPTGDFKHNVYSWYLIMLSLPAIYALYQLCFAMASYSNIILKFLEDCGKKTLSLLGLHRPIWLFVVPICLRLPLPPALFDLIQIVVALAVILPLHSLLSKYFPLLIGQKK